MNKIKPLERIEIIEKIALVLQEKMTYSKIETYLTAYGIECKNFQPSVNSKRVYVEEILKFVSDEIIIKIAKELDIKIKSKFIKGKTINFWKQGYIKLFISHISKHKDKAKNLQDVLDIYGISAFVAHEDIEASKEWQEEIEKALHTMDAMTVILTKEIKESEWCDQEIGFAVGKESLIIPIQYGLIPYGFIGKYQAIQGVGKTVGEVAFSIYQAVLNNEKTGEKIQRSLTNLTANSTRIDVAIRRLNIIEKSNNFSVELIAAMSEKIRENSVLLQSEDFMNKLKIILKKYDIDPSVLDKRVTNSINEIDEDEIPF